MRISFTFSLKGFLRLDPFYLKFARFVETIYKFQHNKLNVNNEASNNLEFYLTCSNRLIKIRHFQKY